MAGEQRRGGFITVKANGKKYDAHGDFTYNLGKPVRTPIVGPDKTHGYSEKPQPAFIEGAIVDSRDLDLETLLTLENATCVLTLSTGKKIMISEGYYSNEGTGNTAEGKIPFKFCGDEATEIAA